MKEADIISSNLTFILGILTTLVLLTCLLLYRHKKKRSTQADIFRQKILFELKGLYPIPRRLDKDVCGKFRQSIPAIQSAASEFRKYLPSNKLMPFDLSLKNYCDHCMQIKWESCATFNIDKNRGEVGDIGPKEIFRQNLNELLSYAKPFSKNR